MLLYLRGPTKQGTKCRPHEFEDFFEARNVVLVSGLWLGLGIHFCVCVCVIVNLNN